MGKYLKLFQKNNDYFSYRESSDFIYPNVSYAEDVNIVYYNPSNVTEKYTIKCTYNVTPDYEPRAFYAGGYNIKGLKVDGTDIEFEPAIIIDGLIESYASGITNVDINANTCSFPDTYVSNLVCTNRVLKPKDSTVNVKDINAVCGLSMETDGTKYVYYYPLSEDTYFRKDEANNQILLTASMIEQLGWTVEYQSVGFILCNAELAEDQYTPISYSFVDTVQEYETSEGGLQEPYYFDSTGEHIVEFELTKPVVPIRMFNECEVTSVVMSDNITTIGGFAFYGCYKLTGELVIPDSVTTIDDGAFGFYSEWEPEGKPGFTKITIGENCKNIGWLAFVGQRNLKEIICKSFNAPKLNPLGTFLYFSYFGKLTYPEGADYSSWFSSDPGTLGEFGWNQEPPVITCTYNVTSTATSTQICNTTTDIANITIDGVTMEEVLTTYTFPTTGNHTVEFTLATTSLPHSMFAYCYNMTQVEVGEGVCYLSQYAFQNCTALKTVYLPDTLRDIKFYAFPGCVSLTSIFIPDNVKRIDRYAFSGCTSLQRLMIGYGCEEINDYAFYNCSALNEIVCDSTTPAYITSKAFYGVKREGELIVAIGSDYSSWMNTKQYYLGYYGWTKKEI